MAPITSSIPLNNFAKVKMFLKKSISWLEFAADYIMCVASDNHTSSPNSCSKLRKLYSVTQGKSQEWLSLPYTLIHPAKHQAQSQLSSALRGLGYYRIEASENTSKVAATISKKLSDKQIYEVLPGFEKGKNFATFNDALNNPSRIAARLNHHRDDVCSIPEVWQLIELLKLHEIAENYLNCKPVLTSVDSWHVLPIGSTNDRQGTYSAAAQTYHYDMDWIKFLKVFVNLTDVSTTNGPFEFIPRSHLSKDKSYFRDGRFEKLVENEESPILAIGPAGTTFLADTSGLHRDGRATAGSRQVLQLEFSVSSFGAKFQYNQLYADSSKRIPFSKIPLSISKHPRLLNLFTSRQRQAN